MTMNFRWTRPPSTLAKGIEAFARQLLTAIFFAAVRWGQTVQDQGRRNAPWEDRTGAARSGLFFAVDGFGQQPVTGSVSVDAGLMTDVASLAGDAETLVIAFGHTVYYGKFLELANGGRFAVIMSTIETNLQNLERMLQGIVK